MINHVSHVVYVGVPLEVSVKKLQVSICIGKDKSKMFYIYTTYTTYTTMPDSMRGILGCISFNIYKGYTT